jgi:hypothetical protein
LHSRLAVIREWFAITWVSRPWMILRRFIGQTLRRFYRGLTVVGPVGIRTREQFPPEEFDRQQFSSEEFVADEHEESG